MRDEIEVREFRNKCEHVAEVAGSVGLSDVAGAIDMIKDVLDYVLNED